VTLRYVADDAPETPAELVRALRRKAGSHDKLAERLGTLRQTVIRWEKGGGISEIYAVKLAELSGLPVERFLRARQTAAAARDAELARLQEEVAELRGQVAKLLRERETRRSPGARRRSA
jgi:transcriptional regulator with XRE-family HTH domain